MMTADDGRPTVADSAEGLGVRVPADVKPDPQDRVHPSGEQLRGMSVAPEPADLPPHRIPPKWLGVAGIREAKGRKDLEIWRMGAGPFESAPVAERLILTPDAPRNGRVSHGVVEPDRTMLLREYRAALASTRDEWRIEEPEVES